DRSSLVGRRSGPHHRGIGRAAGRTGAGGGGGLAGGAAGRRGEHSPAAVAPALPGGRRPGPGRGRAGRGDRGTRARPSRRPSQVAGGLARVGAGPSTVTGVRQALEPGRGETAAPVRTAMVGFGIAGAPRTGALPFAASLDRLARTPSLQGWNWDVAVGNPNDQRDITPK